MTHDIVSGDEAASTGPLAGTLVVDLSRALAGPHAGMMLGDLGARVVKIEAVGSGDETRRWGPPFVGPENDRQSSYFLSCNRNKESLALDLKSAADIRILTALLERADVVIENFRTGVMDRLGLSMTRLHEINPRLVILSITGFGHDGPEAARAGYDQIVQGEAGLMSITGSGPDDPQRVGVPIADLLSGMYGAYGVLAALIERTTTGVGTVVRTSLLSAVVGVHAFQGTRVTVADEVPQAQGNHHPSIAPYGLFECADGSVQISVGNESLWQRLCERFGIDGADPLLVDNAQRVRHRGHTIEVVERAFAAFNAAELLAALSEAGIPAGTVRSLDEVYRWDQAISQGLLLEVEHPTLGPIELPGPPIRFFTTDGDAERETTKRRHLPPPLLDEHGPSIREWLGEGATR
ncbi:CaiB/BaiF CoA transferase family protein [Agreia pratensis]|uniref:Crotonobetainyl-CoA:carnitine CoA-transferase CaiB n=1 Tax=Agreia pratensis TaxID=150121 RepID=A0A1X7I741_9MICO|nr:CoA transferase [Agreia pratensis]SMG09872.1 Crotonobetainyl-CoA:carnitine CoA-transferase CaiB [Agreia pratensis]